ncbi:MAG: AMP-binding protein [Bacilli bacterium]|nr:AMP-binding protein [Bacilli bacterium]
MAYVEKNYFTECTTKEIIEKIVHYETLTSLWENAKKIYPNELALMTINEKLTYAELDEKVAYFRALLKEHNVKKGDIVGLFITNSVDWVKVFLAIVTLGAVPTLLPPFLPKEALFGLSQKYHMNVLVYNSSLQETIDGLNTMPHHLDIINSSDTSSNTVSSVNVDKKDPACIIFTGGTTGKSKGALLSHQAITRGAQNGCYGVRDPFHQRLLLVLPLTHVFGLVRNLLTSLQTGSTLWICLNNKDMFKDIAIFKPTTIVMVPALAEMALNLSKQFKRNMLGDSLEYIIAGASTVPPYLVKEYKAYNITLLPGYGLTESANLVSGNPNSEYKPASVGFPYPHQDLKIVDGELLIKGDNVFDGYYLEEEENKNAFTEDGYFKTGDLVRFDEEGYLYIVGRIKDIIVLNTGEKLSPFDLENKFDELDLIQDCLLYLNEATNELTLSVYPRYIELNKLDVEDKIAYLKRQINQINNNFPAHMRVNKIIIRKEDFTRTPAMKIIRKEINYGEN